MNTWLDYLTGEQHRQHLLEQAENARLAARARAGSRNNWQSKGYRLLLASLGKWLVLLGERMQQSAARRNVAPKRLRTQW